MIGDILQPTHLLFILVIALLVLGPKRLPEVGRSLGRGLRDFRSALNGVDPREHLMGDIDTTIDHDPTSDVSTEPTAPAHEPSETAPLAEPTEDAAPAAEPTEPPLSAAEPVEHIGSAAPKH